jgi:23S rRNA pseudouridine1911/1915/1917 synthase
MRIKTQYKQPKFFNGAESALMKKSQSLSSKKVIFQVTFAEPTAQSLTGFLKQSSPISGRSLSKYFFKGLVFLNNRPAHSKAAIKPGDTVIIYDSDFEYLALTPAAMPLDIVYEDQNLLVINKPAHLVVHPVRNITSGTLANGVAAYFNQTGIHAKVRPVNRLDAGTSGLIIFAKSSGAQDALSEAIKLHQIKRFYYAIVRGVPAREEGIIDRPILERHGRRIISEQGQPAETCYRVIERLKEAAMLELLLKTGRTHQIRVHLSSIGHPILGDSQYGIKNSLIGRPALHAVKLDFGASGFKIPELKAPIPDDFQKLLTELRK